MRTLLVLSLLLPAAASAEPNLAALDGTWKWAGGAAEKAAVHKAIDRVAGEMNFLVRGTAKDRLRSSNKPPKSVTIARADGQVTVTFGGKRTYTAPLDGPAKTVKGRKGDPLKLTHRWKGGALEQTFQGEKGGRRNVLRASGERLELKVTVFSKDLPGDIVYTLTYAR